MDVTTISDSELGSQIELHQDRIETVREYIADTDDSATRSAMQGQLQRYQMALQVFRQEIQRRTARPLPESSDINTEEDDFEDDDDSEEDEPEEVDEKHIFISSDHLRYENGIHVSGPHGGAKRAIELKPDEKRNHCYYVAIYNMDGDHPIWRNNIQMAPKQMKIVSEEHTIEALVLRGYGHDEMGESYADYGLTVHYRTNGYMSTGWYKIVLHMYERGIDIEYLR